MAAAAGDVNAAMDVQARRCRSFEPSEQRSSDK
jgi:hypothetical protein